MFNFNAKCKEFFWLNKNLILATSLTTQLPFLWTILYVLFVTRESAVSECVMSVFGTRIIIFFSVYIYTVYRGGVWIEVDKGYICPLLYEENKRCGDVTVYLL